MGKLLEGNCLDATYILYTCLPGRHEETYENLEIEILSPKFEMNLSLT
jgi:hypothetical protein